MEDKTSFKKWTRTVAGIFTAIGFLMMVMGALYLFLAQTTTQFSVYPEKATAAAVALSGTVATAQHILTPATIPPTGSRELHIANNGLTLLRRAEVVSISENSLQVAMSWSSRTITWNIRIKSSTKLLSRKGLPETLEDIHVGDSLTITGMLQEDGSVFSLDAQFIRK